MSELADAIRRRRMLDFREAFNRALLKSPQENYSEHTRMLVKGMCAYIEKYKGKIQGSVFEKSALRMVAQHVGEQIDWNQVIGAYVDALISNSTVAMPMYDYPLEFLSSTFKNFNVNAQSNKSGISLLMCAAASKSCDEVFAKRLIELGADVNLLSKRHGRAVHFIHVGRHSPGSVALDKLNAFIEFGANPGEKIRYVPIFPAQEGSNHKSYSGYSEYLGAVLNSHFDPTRNNNTALMRTHVSEMLSIVSQFNYAEDAVLSAQSNVAEKRRTHGI